MKRIIGKGRLAERDKHAQDVRDAVAELNGSITTYNTAIAAAKADLEAAFDKVNETICQVRDWRDEIVGEMESYEGERSDKWQESDMASMFQDWKSEWENAELDELDEFDFPTDLEEVDSSRADAIDALPESVEG